MTDPANTTPDRDPVLDPEALLRLSDAVGGDTVAELLSTFRTSLIRYRDDLVRLAAEGNAEALGRSAHALTGLCAHFGAIEAGELARILERCATVPRDARAVLIDLVAALEELDREIAQRFGRPPANP